MDFLGSWLEISCELRRRDSGLLKSEILNTAGLLLGGEFRGKHREGFHQLADAALLCPPKHNSGKGSTAGSEPQKVLIASDQRTLLTCGECELFLVGRSSNPDSADVVTSIPRSLSLGC